MLPVWAIVGRDLRKFFRSPALMTVSLFLPLLQLVIIGYAVGGQVRNIEIALVTLDRGPEALELRQKLNAIEANSRVLDVRLDAGLDQAIQATRHGRVSAAIVIPENYSADVRRGAQPRLGLLVDNTDPFIVAALSAKLTELVDAINQPAVESRLVAQVTLDLVELFPYIDYVQYLLPGAITLAIFVCTLVGGGLVYVDDKARGLHEGYLVTPITKPQLVVGMWLSGTLKCAFSGLVVTIVGSMIAGVGHQLTFDALGLLVILCLTTAMALTGLIGLLMVRVADPHIPRAAFGVLNVLLFFPSGAMYPVESFPAWLRLISAIDPFTYAVHGLRSVLLKQVGVGAIAGDLLFLVMFALACLLGTLLLFQRRL